MENLIRDFINSERTVEEKVKFIREQTGLDLYCHRDLIRTLHVSADDNYLISGSSDKSIKVWDTHSLNPINTIKQLEDSVSAITVLDPLYLVCGYMKGPIQVFDRTHFTPLSWLYGHSGLVSAILALPNNTQIVSSSWDISIRIWSLITFCQEYHLTSHQSLVNSLILNPSYSQLISVSDDKTIKIWNLNTFLLESTLNGHTKGVMSIAINGKHSLIASGSQDNCIGLWDLKTLSLLEMLKGHEDWVSCLNFTSDTQYLVSASWDMFIFVWSLATFKPIQILYGQQSPVISMALSRYTNKVFASYRNNSLCCFKINEENQHKLIGGHYSYIRCLIYTKSQKIISSGDDATIRVWEGVVGQCKVRILIGHSKSVNLICVNQKEDKLCSSAEDFTIRVWDLCKFESLHVFDCVSLNIVMILWSYNDRYCIGSSSDGVIHLNSIETGSCIRYSHSISVPSSILSTQKHLVVCYDKSKAQIYKLPDY